MGQTVNNIEATIKREITKVYKENIGKGPESTTVRAFDNIIFIRFEGGMTQLEHTLMNTEDGEALVRKIREELFLNQSSLYVPVIENIVDSKVAEVGFVVRATDNSVYMTCVLEDDIKIN